jgi:hypothetical protein
MDERVLTRRNYLITAGTVGGVTLSGCAGGGSPDGGDGSGGDGSDAPSGGSSASLADFPSLSAPEPTFRNWVPGTGDYRATFDAAYNVARARENRSALSGEAYESVTGWTMFGGYVGIEFEEIDGLLFSLGSPPVAVYLGSFARADVESRLESTRYERFESRNGVSYYRNQSGEQSTALGVGDRGVVYGTVDRDAETPGGTFLEETGPLFETARGERPRLHEESDLYARYTEAIGWPLVAAAIPPRPADPSGPGSAGGSGTLPAADALPEAVRSSVQYGYGRYLADGTLVDRSWLRTEDGASASPDDVRNAYTSGDVASQFEGDESLAVRTDGRVVDVAVLTPIDDPGGGADPVIASLDVSVASGSATIDHVAGDPVPLDRIAVRAGSDWVAAGDGTLAPGESTTVDVGDADRVTVVYESPNGDSRTVLGSA